MLVYMRKDLEKVGMAGQVVKVKRGYAENFLIPQGYSVKASANEVTAFMQIGERRAQDKQVLESKTSMLAERLKTATVTLTEKVHDNGKLYGAVGSKEVAAALKAQGFAVDAKQVEIDKAIKAVGKHVVTVKLSNRLKAEVNVVVVAEK